MRFQMEKRSKCLCCPAWDVCMDDEFPIVASCEEMKKIYRIARKHISAEGTPVPVLSLFSETTVGGYELRQDNLPQDIKAAVENRLANMLVSELLNRPEYYTIKSTFDPVAPETRFRMMVRVIPAEEAQR